MYSKHKQYLRVSKVVICLVETFIFFPFNIGNFSVTREFWSTRACLKFFSKQTWLWPRVPGERWGKQLWLVVCLSSCIQRLFCLRPLVILPYLCFGCPKDFIHECRPKCLLDWATRCWVTHAIWGDGWSNFKQEKNAGLIAYVLNLQLKYRAWLMYQFANVIGQQWPIVDILVLVPHYALILKLFLMLGTYLDRWFKPV